MKTIWFWTRANVILCVSDRIQLKQLVYDNIEMKNSKKKKILRVIIDNKLGSKVM